MVTEVLKWIAAFIPLPSENIMPFSGDLVYRGEVRTFISLPAGLAC